MQVVKDKEYPPNYEDIVQAFPEVKDNPDVVFSYGEYIYNPAGNPLPTHLEVHENVHQRQQEGRVKEWWNIYLTSPQFRLEQELEAYSVEYRYIQSTENNKTAKAFLDYASSMLSSPIYGNIINFYQAHTAIRKYGRG